MTPTSYWGGMRGSNWRESLAICHDDVSIPEVGLRKSETDGVDPCGAQKSFSFEIKRFRDHAAGPRKSAQGLKKKRSLG
jgi:hypothetical protein